MSVSGLGLTSLGAGEEEAARSRHEGGALARGSGASPTAFPSGDGPDVCRSITKERVSNPVSSVSVQLMYTKRKGLGGPTLDYTEDVTNLGSTSSCELLHRKHSC